MPNSKSDKLQNSEVTKSENETPNKQNTGGNKTKPGKYDPPQIDYLGNLEELTQASGDPTV